MWVEANARYFSLPAQDSCERPLSHCGLLPLIDRLGAHVGVAALVLAQSLENPGIAIPPHAPTIAIVSRSRKQRLRFFHKQVPGISTMCLSPSADLDADAVVLSTRPLTSGALSLLLLEFDNRASATSIDITCVM